MKILKKHEILLTLNLAEKSFLTSDSHFILYFSETKNKPLAFSQLPSE